METEELFESINKIQSGKLKCDISNTKEIARKRLGDLAIELYFVVNNDDKISDMTLWEVERIREKIFAQCLILQDELRHDERKKSYVRSQGI